MNAVEQILGTINFIKINTRGVGIMNFNNSSSHSPYAHIEGYEGVFIAKQSFSGSFFEIGFSIDDETVSVLSIKSKKLNEASNKLDISDFNIEISSKENETPQQVGQKVFTRVHQYLMNEMEINQKFEDFNIEIDNVDYEEYDFSRMEMELV